VVGVDSEDEGFAPREGEDDRLDEGEEVPVEGEAWIVVGCGGSGACLLTDSEEELVRGEISGEEAMKASRSHSMR